MVSTDDDELAGLVRMLLKHGGKDKYNVDHIGYNARLDTIQAAVLLAKLKYIDEFNKKRRKIAELYNQGLHGISGLTYPASELPNFRASNLYHVYHQYTIRTEKRDELQAHLKENGVSTMVYYLFPLHKMKVFGEGSSKIFGNLINAESACRSVLSLPIEPLQREEDTSCIIENIKRFFK